MSTFDEYWETTPSHDEVPTDILFRAKTVRIINKEDRPKRVHNVLFCSYVYGTIQWENSFVSSI